MVKTFRERNFVDVVGVERKFMSLLEATLTDITSCFCYFLPPYQPSACVTVKVTVTTEVIFITFDTEGCEPPSLT